MRIPTALAANMALTRSPLSLTHRDRIPSFLTLESHSSLAWPWCPATSALAGTLYQHEAQAKASLKAFGEEDGATPKGTCNNTMRQQMTQVSEK